MKERIKRLWNKIRKILTNTYFNTAFHLPVFMVLTVCFVYILFSINDCVKDNQEILNTVKTYGDTIVVGENFFSVISQESNNCVIVFSSGHNLIIDGINSSISIITNLKIEVEEMDIKKVKFLE